VAVTQHPAADVAAQAAAALALMSRVALDYGTEADKQAARNTWIPKARRAYNYAKLMWQKHGDMSSCTNSAANGNCVGAGCTKVDANGDPVLTVCFAALSYAILLLPNDLEAARP
jgi:hypothetical protein